MLVHFLPFLLALIAPTTLAVKYLTQFLKPAIDALTKYQAAALATMEKRLFVLVLGAIALPAIGLLAGPYFHATLPFNAQDLAGAAVFGAGAGLAAIGDYHLLDAIKAVASSPPTPTA